MSTLDFIPRTLKRRKAEVEAPLSAHEVQSSSSKPLQSTEETTPSQVAPSESKDKVVPKSQKKKQQQGVKPSWEFAFLVWLALSDYWLWADGDLRRRTETGENAVEDADVPEGNPSGDSMVDKDNTEDEKESRDISSEQGYVPLDHLLKKSHVFRLVSNLQPYCNAKEIIYVNSLRQFAKDAIDVRFIVGPGSSSARGEEFGSGRRRRAQSGYEVRRTDFSSLKESEFSRYSKSHWDALTVYMENIPIKYAGVPGIGNLVTTLLPASGGPPMKRVQNIVFPPHHQDLPGSIPTCKGFALMTLSSEDDVQSLLDAWPWNSEKRTSDDSTKLKQEDMTLDKKVNDPSAEERSAKTSGLRICTKSHWEELRAEYLLHRQQLIDETNQYQNEEDARRQETVDKGQYTGPREEDQLASSSKRKQHESTAQYDAGIHPDSPYPPACLVFVRHVHPETNKTTLRTLFSQVWAESNNAIDYVDYSKNTDSCYVRFGTPSHAELFVDYFSSHRIAQLSGLDSSGSESSEVRPIAPEIVLGEREDVYWLKIPEKLRRQAVEKTLKAMHGADFVGGSSAAVEEAPQEGAGGGRRKRRRKAKGSE